MKYRIIEIDDDSASLIKIQSESGVMSIGTGRVLSEEETLDKLREVYQGGVRFGSWIFDEYGRKTDRPQEFEELIKEL